MYYNMMTLAKPGLLAPIMGSNMIQVPTADQTQYK